MTEKARPWMSDVPVSKPDPVNIALPVLVDFGGVGMNAAGLTTTLTQGEVEDVFMPVYAPQGFRG